MNSIQKLDSPPLPPLPLPRGLQTANAVSPATGATSSAKAQKLQKAAAEFESMLMSTFWKSMKESFGNDDDDSSDPAHETLSDFGMQAMCGALGKAGGLGMGKLILQHLMPKLDGKTRT